MGLCDQRSKTLIRAQLEVVVVVGEAEPLTGELLAKTREGFCELAPIATVFGYPRKNDPLGSQSFAIRDQLIEAIFKGIDADVAAADLEIVRFQKVTELWCGHAVGAGELYVLEPHLTNGRQGPRGDRGHEIGRAHV